jgi:hypothetical protein
MNDLHIQATHNTPDIILSTSGNRFIICGKSAPEDVRSLYYPVIEWLTSFIAETLEKNSYTVENPLVFKIDLSYFNSSSAKFIFDIFTHLRELKEKGVAIIIEWYYEADDIDLLEAGEDMAALTGHKFSFIQKAR